MRTNIEIDDKLMAKAMKATGARTKRETVDRALTLLVQMEAQQELLRMRGKVTWEGDLDAMRTD